MPQRPPRPTPEQRAQARQAASDTLCEALDIEPFALPDHVSVPSGFSPLTSPLFPEWMSHATRAVGVERPSPPRPALGVGFCLLLGRRPPSVVRISQRLHENEPLDKDLPQLWRRVVELVGAHRDSVRLPDLKVWFGRHPIPAEDSPAVTPYARMGIGLEAEDFETSLIYTVIELLSACTTLRECDECKRLFVATRRQKRHPKCARKYHDRNRPSRRRTSDEG